MGEWPELPPSVIRELRTHMLALRHQAADKAWDFMSTAAVPVFESWHRQTP